MGDRGTIQIPDLLADGMVMRVDDVAFLAAMPCDVKTARRGRAANRSDNHPPRTMIVGADIDIVHVEQEPAIGAVRHLAHELPFSHLGLTGR